MGVKIKVAIKDESMVLRDPKTMERLTVEGKLVDKTSFWVRRIKAGDCILVEDAPVKKTISKPSKKGAK